jgi:hypothetical protein
VILPNKSKRKAIMSLQKSILSRQIVFINRHPVASEELIKHAKDYFKRAKKTPSSSFEDAINLFVKAIELNPDEPKYRKAFTNYLRYHERELEKRNFNWKWRPKFLYGKIKGKSDIVDYTKHCFISRKPDRAYAARHEIYMKSFEFLTNAGISGDVLEFGVLAGWSSRILAEIMRDEMFLGDLYLFDSFEGLPAISSDVDKTSYDIGERN